ncbi:hypothetical protein KBZ21_41560, partial [Streptomyces sp. A73]|nr:hypothetical protein [Streptomyces sp. A73]
EAGQTLEVAMGTHGPIPKRSEERRRRNKDEGPELSKAPSGAPAEALLTEEWIVPTLEAVRGDSTWLDIDRLKASILDTRNP